MNRGHAVSIAVLSFATLVLTGCEKPVAPLSGGMARKPAFALAPAGTVTRLSSGSATDQQNAPAISGNQVVWTDASTGAGGSNFDIVSLDLANPGTPINLTNTPIDQEFLEDI